MMKTIALGMTIAILAGPSNLHADGKFYVPRDTPPVDEPYQRAIVSFRNGEEILIVQPKFVGATKDFGWVIPVPSLPMMDYVTNDKTEYLFRDFGFAAAPQVNHYGEIVFLILLGLAAIGFLVTVANAFGFFRRFGWEPIRPTVRWLTYASFGFLLLVFSPSITGTLGAGDASVERDVEVLASSRVGIYETHVIRPVERKTGALIDWLTANGFHYSSDDAAVFQSYVDKEWLFVTAKIAAPRAETTGDGLLQTLMLRFASPVPVYPFALSATSGKPTTVLLYVLSDRRMSHPLLTTEFAGESRRKIYFYVGEYDNVPDQLCIVSLHPAYLTRMKGTISSAETREDLILTPDAAGGDFRRSVWRW